MIVKADALSCLEGNMDSNIINFQTGQSDWRQNYRYSLYNHKLIAANGEVYTRPFIVIKNHYGVIIRFTTLHNYAGIFENKVFVPVTSDSKAKLHYICMMLNYVLIERYVDFRIDHVFKVSREMLERFFRDYATECCKTSLRAMHRADRRKRFA